MSETISESSRLSDGNPITRNTVDFGNLLGRFIIYSMIGFSSGIMVIIPSYSNEWECSAADLFSVDIDSSKIYRSRINSIRFSAAIWIVRERDCWISVLFEELAMEEFGENSESMERA